MKKILLFVFTLLISALTGQVKADSPVKVGELYYFLNHEDKTATVTNGYGGFVDSSSEYDELRYQEQTAYVPATIWVTTNEQTYQNEEYTVTAIGEYAFNWTPIRMVTLPNTIKKIDQYAFYWMQALKNITIPGSVEIIAKNNFIGCASLNTVVLAESENTLVIETENDAAPFQASPVKKFKMMRNINYTGNGLMNQKPLTEIFVGGAVTEIPDYTFANLTGGYFNLYMYPATAPKANDNVFYGTKTFEDFEDGKTYFYEAYLNLMTRFETKASAEAAGYYDGVWGKFYYGERINFLADDVEYKDIYANENNDMVVMWDMQTQGNGEKDTIRTMVVSGRRLWFERYAPDKVRVIQPMLKYNTWSSRPFHAQYLGGKYVIPDSIDFPIERFDYNGDFLRTDYVRCSVAEIGYNAFNYSKVSEVVLPEHLEVIAAQAFFNCPNLKHIDFPDNIKIIDSGAFADPGRDAVPGGLEGTVVLPKNLEYLGEYAFRCCDYIENVVFPSTLDTIPGYCFWGCSKLNNVVVPGTVKAIMMGAFSACTGLQHITLEEGIELLDQMLFPGCPLTELEIPASVKQIHPAMLNRIENDIPIRVKEGNQVYDSRDNCNAIVETNSNMIVSATRFSFIPESIDTIGSGSFYEMFLNRITLPQNLKKIQPYSFNNPVVVVSRITNPAGVLEEGAIASWNGNTTIYVPAGTKALYEADAEWSQFDIVEQEPAGVGTVTTIGEETTVSFEGITAETDLTNAVIGNAYLTCDTLAGDGYDAQEKAIVLKTVVAEQTIDLLLSSIGFEDVLQNIFTGIVLKVPAGTGTITISALTQGDRQVGVAVQGMLPELFTQNTKGDIEVDYDVEQEAYVLVYGVEKEDEVVAAPSRVRRKLAQADESDNLIKIYGVKATANDVTALPDVVSAQSGKTVKQIIDGQLYIIHNGKVYTPAGVEVK